MLRDFAALQMLIFRAVGLANPATQDFCLRFLNRTNDPYTRKALSDHVDNEDREDGVTIRDAIGRWVLYLRRTLRMMARPWALIDCWRTMPLLLAD